jgi:hypothetical protein
VLARGGAFPMDIIIIALAVAFFLISGWLIFGLDRLQEK